MIENPQNLKEQLLNLTETIATEMKTLKNSKLDLHGKADTAIKADQDASGNVITTTYATKQELEAHTPNLTGYAKEQEILNAAKAASVSANTFGPDIENLKKNKEDTIKIINHGVSNTTFTLPVNEYHIWGEVSSLNITIPADSDTILQLFAFQFTSGSTPTNLVLNGAKFISEVDIEANKIYQVTVCNGIAALGGVDK